jgi:hypothetical protein
MKLRLAFASACALGSAAALWAADPPPKVDIVTPDKRRVVVELAKTLTRPPAPAPIPADLTSPFAPVGFDLPDPDDRPPPPPVNPIPKTPNPASTAPAAVQGDREVLEALAAKLLPSGSLIAPSGDRMLIFGRNKFKIGAHFTVTSAGADFDLELTAVDSTTFTLRYRNQEITRPIRPGK